eukprot:scaffold131539_cov33-Tisochrysis_lutea.AAC.4
MDLDQLIASKHTKSTQAPRVERRLNVTTPKHSARSHASRSEKGGSANMVSAAAQNPKKVIHRPWSCLSARHA